MLKSTVGAILAALLLIPSGASATAFSPGHTAVRTIHLRGRGRETIEITISDPSRHDQVAVEVGTRTHRSLVVRAGRKARVDLSIGAPARLRIRVAGRHARPDISVKARPLVQARMSSTSARTHKRVARPASGPTATTSSNTSASTTPAPNPSATGQSSGAAQTTPVASPTPVSSSLAPTAASSINTSTTMPVGDLPGWKQVMADDFNGTSLDSCWGAYQGVPGSSPTALWEPSHVVVSGGLARLETYQDPLFGGGWVTAGMSAWPCLKQEYGKYEIRFRMDNGPGVKYAILLWPSSAPWPCGGEIDFGEDSGGSPRNSTTLTTHYCDASGQNAILPQQTAKANFTQWHTLGIEWTAGRIVWTLDGANVATVTSSHVPADAMQLAIQTETNSNCNAGYPCLTSTTPSLVQLDVDWVVAYAPAA